MTMQDYTYKKRLLTLVALLEKLPPHRFNFNRWASNDKAWDRTKIDNSEIFKDCGTVGCAMGWATTIPHFRKLGLHLYKWMPCMRDPKITGSNYAEAIYAAMELFGLLEDEALFCFSPGNTMDDRCSPPVSANAKTVAKHLADFAERKWPAKQKVCRAKAYV